MVDLGKDTIIETSPKGRFAKFNETLGSGAYKTVFRGYDYQDGREVAWNVVMTNSLTEAERRRLQEEIQLLKNLKHTNIIHFIAVWFNKVKNEVVFITEILTGGSLKHYLKKIKNPRLRVIKKWCQAIIAGLMYLHSHNPPIIHRDLKCDNIFINCDTGDIRIGDLGLSTVMTGAFNKTILGTPEYMAPEVYEEQYHPAVDIYAFGMCVLEMVTLKPPYSECKNPVSIYKKVISRIPPQDLDLILDLEVRQFIEMCLRPEDSRPTAAEIMVSPFLQIDEADERIHQPVPMRRPSMSESPARSEPIIAPIERERDQVTAVPIAFTVDIGDRQPKKRIEFMFQVNQDVAVNVAAELVSALNDMSGRDLRLPLQELVNLIKRQVESYYRRDALKAQSPMKKPNGLYSVSVAQRNEVELTQGFH